MSRRARFIKRPEIRLDATLPIPLYKQLYDRLRGTILEGQLERGARLPSTRTLASELGISRTTTALAYQQLLLEGYLESQVGKGTVGHAICLRGSFTNRLTGRFWSKPALGRPHPSPWPHRFARSRTSRIQSAEKGERAGSFTEGNPP